MRAGALRHISQGEFAVGRGPDDVIATLLGSCVSACLWDPEAGVGGMNHILLPEREARSAANLGGAAEMEQLINAILRAGGERTRLRAKIFGGASMLSGRTNIGAMNADFLARYLAREGIRVMAESLGGTQARRVRFRPGTGDVRMQFAGIPQALPVAPVRQANDVELF